MGWLGALRAKSGALLARGVFSLSAGLGYPFTKSGVRVVVLAQLGLAAVALGPSRAVKLGFQATLLAVAGRTVVILAKTMPQKMELDKDAQQQMWEWDPPGELGESGAWRVVRELAQALTRGSDEFPELKDMQTLPLQELAVRLCYKFDDGQKEPIVDSEVEGADDGAVTAELLDKLQRYLHFSNLIYEAPTDRTLQRLLGDQGFVLNYSKLESDWEAKAPAYFLATNMESREFLLSLRGTSQLDDMITDVTAVPEEFDGGPEQAHGGMAAGAAWLLDRFLPLAKGMREAGFTIKICGHSLGGGMAALLGLMLLKRGVDGIECYGFATPPCCTPPLAEECCKFFQDVAFRSDIVSRFSPQSLAFLHEELRKVDWQSEEQKARQKDNRVLGNVAKLAGAVNRLAALFGGASAEDEQADADSRERSMQDTEKQLGSYQPIKPGRVLYCYRKKPELNATEDALGRTMVKGGCAQLRHIHVNAFMVQDHTIPNYFIAIDRDNPMDNEEEQQKEAEETGEAAEQGCGEQNEDK